MCSVKYAVCSMQCVVFSMQCAVGSAQCAESSVHCVMFSVQCLVCSVVQRNQSKRLEVQMSGCVKVRTGLFLNHSFLNLT